MPIDYRRLVGGLSAMSDLVVEAPGLPALQMLIATAQETAGAVGATFMEFRGEVGRVVLATGAMMWALGQPIGPQHQHLRHQPPYRGPRPVETLPADLAGSMLSHGIRSLTACRLHRGEQPVGVVHLYFDRLVDEDAEEIQSIVDLTASVARHIFAPPDTASLSVADAEDRALFLAVAGHELRTPVTVLKGYAGMLADRWDSLDEANRREAARVLCVRADELARLVDRLLRASAGDDEAGWLVRAVPFDPVQALRRAVHDLPVDLRRTLRLELPSSLPAAIGDATLLPSIVAELVTNAVRATPPPTGVGSAGGAGADAPAVANGAGSAGGSGRGNGAGAPSGATPGPGVPARADATGRAGADPASVLVLAGADDHTVYFQIRDRGVGIDPTQAEIAFERFWRSPVGGDGRTGVGLGLYLVRRLVERQMGWVSLRPRDGGGTVAEVRLLRADGPARLPSLGEA